MIGRAISSKTKIAEYSYDDVAGKSAKKSVAWNALSLVGRQGLLIVFSLVLARILGPESYGVVAQANVYMVVATLLLDQGLTASLVSRSRISRRVVAAAAGLNLTLAAIMMLVTYLTAPMVASFFSSPQLIEVLWVLGAGLVFKALAIVPRMLLTRTFAFRAIAIADVLGAFLGGFLGLIFAMQGAGYWSLVIQLVVSDAFVAAVLLISARAPIPSLRFVELKGTIKFGIKIFIGNLFSVASRNTDNLVVGRILGSGALALYSLAYRVLLTPVQMVGQVVTRVLLPAVARSQSDLERVSLLTLRSISSISIVSFPLMALIAISAEDSVNLVLGNQWAGAVPVLQILALTGARQAVTAVNAPILIGLGKANTHLRFNIIAAIVQVGGILIGLQGGIVGVAWGYTISGILLTPYIIFLQKRLVGTTIRDMFLAVFPAFHASFWAAGAYLILNLSAIPLILRMSVGLISATIIYIGILWIAHRKFSRIQLSLFKEMFRKRSQEEISIRKLT